MRKSSFLLILFIFLSCWDENSKVLPPAEVEEGYISLTVKLPGVNMPATYALSEAGENQIDEIDVLVFVKTDTGEKFEYWAESGVITDIEDAENGNKKKFRVKLKRTSELVQLVLIANSREIIKEADLIKGESKAAILNKLIFNANTVWPTEGTSFEPFPMWGESSFLSVNTFSEIKENISLIRAVAKIDIGVDIDKDPALGFGNLFKLHEIYVCNSNTKGYVAPNLTNFSNNKVFYPNVDATWEKNVPLKYIYRKDTNDKIQTFFQEIYIPESEENTIRLIIAAYYDGSLTPGYYRIDFVDNSDAASNSYLSILRNHRYLINITGLKGPGYDTWEEAYAAKAANLVYSLEVSEEEINDIDYNGQYLLGIDGATTFIDEFDPERRRTSVSVYTTYEEGWKATIQEEYEEWLTLENATGMSNRVGSLTIRATHLTDSFERIGYVHLQAGNLQKEIKVIQRIGYNSYFVVPTVGTIAGGISIPMAVANADGNIRLTNQTDYSVKVIWQDKINLIKTIDIGNYETPREKKKDYIHVETSTEGNAVIGIVNNSTGQVIWSWHLWSLKTPTLIAEIEQGGYIFMDRNLGAVSTSGTGSYGLVYQWGRKDPFPGADESTTNGSHKGTSIYTHNPSVETAIEYKEVTVNENIENAISNPSTFYTSGNAPYYDWYGLYNANNMLWDREDSKTSYDPCPKGWRVPLSGTGTRSPWYGLSSSNGGQWNNGWTWNGSYHPAAGGRDGFTGAFVDVGIRGYIWSASPVGFGIYMFQYAQNQSGINPNGRGDRSSAYPVRCVKE